MFSAISDYYHRYFGRGGPRGQGDKIQELIGGFGRYQCVFFFLSFLCKFPTAGHQMAIIFLAPPAEYVCPSTQKQSCPCPNPIYDKSKFDNTMVMQWNLICEKKPLISLSQTLFQLGTLIGSIIFGMASDRFGRRKPLLVAVIMQIVFGLGAAYMPNYWLFTIMRLIVGITSGAILVITFVILMEIIGAKYRESVGALYHAPFNLGHMTLPLLGYYIKTYDKLQLVTTCMGMGQILYFCFVDESARWLIAAKKTDEAIKLITFIAKRNKMPTDYVESEVRSFQAQCDRNKLKKGTVVDLFRYPNLRKNILAMSFNWFTCSYGFYGVSQYVGSLGGNIYYNVLSSASVTLCGTLISVPLLKCLGRRTMCIVFNFLGAVCLFLIPVVPEGIPNVICVSVGVVSSFIVFIVVYLYCSELFPTVVRNAAIGFSSMMARVGSMIAPFVLDLGEVALWLPPIVFGSMPLLATFISLLMPETKGCELLTTIEEGEKFGTKPKT